jgi:hypothetical protein
MYTGESRDRNFDSVKRLSEQIFRNSNCFLRRKQKFYIYFSLTHAAALKSFKTIYLRYTEITDYSPGDPVPLENQP